MEKYIYRIIKYTVVAILLFNVINLSAQNKNKTNIMTAIELYDVFCKNDKETLKEYRMKTMIISGIAVKVGPDMYGLPSVELAGKEGDKCKVLCVLPFTDYLKLRHVSKKDRVELRGEIRGYSDEYDLVVVKQCEIISVNGKKP